MTIFPLFYFGPILYYKFLTEAESPVFELYETYSKQNYRTRTSIVTADGLLNLSVPTEKPYHNPLMKDVLVSSAYNWQIQHWRAIQSAYAKTPWFEHYAPYIEQFLSKKFATLHELNTASIQLIIKLLKLNFTIHFTTDFDPIQPEDFRTTLHPKLQLESWNFPTYFQPFNDRIAFVPNASMLDLLFNLGPQSMAYLGSIQSK